MDARLRGKDARKGSDPGCSRFDPGSTLLPMKRIALVLLLLALVVTRSAWALDAAALEKLASGESDDKIAAISALVAEGDPRAGTILEALAAGELQAAGKRLFIVR